jgi:hypothetical protein
VEPFKFKEIVKALGVKFGEILKTQTYAPYSVLDASECPTGQYWVVSASYFTEPDGVIESVLLNFKRSDLRDDHRPDPNDFFSINDRLLKELIALNEQGKLNSLLPVFLEAERECNEEEEFVLIDIEARFASEDNFIRRLLEENVCIIHLYEGNVWVECMQNERKRFFVPVGDRNVLYDIPFDKVELFPRAFQKPAIPGHGEEEDYVFVLMSFIKDPRLEDAYDAIIRGVKRWNPKASVERVDQIEEDFKITDKVIECIDKAVLIIADLTGERPNVYYELGYARAKGKRLIHTAMEGTKLHFDVKDYNTIFWDSGRTLEMALAKRLRSMLRNHSS